VDGSELLVRYGPWALVVGAGAGLGAAYAGKLAAAGFDLVVVDRDRGSVEDLAASLAQAHTSQVRVLGCDLAEDGAADEILRECDGLDVGLVIANAAASHVGPFRDQDPTSFEAQLRVNALVPTALVHGMLPGFARRDRAGVILMSSLSSRRGAPLVATYAATKAYLAILAESLWDELRDDGVDVLAVLPGSTRTPGWLSSNPQSSLGTADVMAADDVVAEALAALGTGPSLVVGEGNRASEAFLESMDRPDAVRMVGQVMRDTYPGDRLPDPTV
jgi:short-subunit dehydrogenase